MKPTDPHLFLLAARTADSSGLCFVHLEEDGSAQYVLMTRERYHEICNRIFGVGVPIPVGDPEWEHSHVSPDVLNDWLDSGIEEALGKSDAE